MTYPSIQAKQSSIRAAATSETTTDENSSVGLGGDASAGAEITAESTARGIATGGGGDDVIWGGENSDWLEGQKGNDILYGGGWIDKIILDTNPDYFNGAAGTIPDSFDRSSG